MRSLSVARVGAVCALVMVLSFVVGIALMAASGVEVLIPETGTLALEWIEDVDSAGNAFLVGAWLTVFGGMAGLVALIGFYDALRAAGPVLVLAPVLGAVGVTLVTFSHLLPIAMADELAPGYTVASASTQAALTVTTDTLASVALFTNYAGNVLGWGVVVPIDAFAILKTNVVPRWIGWVGIVVAVFAGWLGLLALVVPALEAVSVIGFLGFFVFMASMGVALLRRSGSADAVGAPPVAT